MTDASLLAIEDSQLDRELVARGGLREFIKAAWHLVEPAVRFVDNWHVGIICEHLEACTRGEITRLIINIPPGCMKSLSVSVMWPCWTWTEGVDPGHKWIFASYDANLSLRDARKMRSVVTSEWWRHRWPDVKLPPDAARSVREFSNSDGGFRYSTSVAGAVTGRHADTQVVDDPIKPLDVTGGSAVTRKKIEACKEWWGGTMSTRMADPKTARRVIMMQRLHDADLAGQMLEEMKEGGEHYEHLCLPMEHEPKKWAGTSLARAQDPRTEPGELLWPARFDAESVANLKKALGSDASAQLQQDPVPEGGAIFKSEWWQHWGVPESEFAVLPEGMRLEQSWDCTFKDHSTSDWVVGQVWGFTAADAFLLDQIRERLSFTGTIAAIEALTKRWPRAFVKLIENKANGPAVVNVLQRKIPGLQLVEPLGGKEARANAVQPVFASRNVWLPPPESAPWVTAYKTEMERFPRAAHDDQVDATSQALMKFAQGSRLEAYRKAMANAMKRG